MMDGRDIFAVQYAPTGAKSIKEKDDVRTQPVERSLQRPRYRSGYQKKDG